MITEFTLRPKAQNKRARYLFVAFIFGAVAFLILYAVIPSYKGVVGLVAVALVAAAVFMFTKYMASEYYYDITVENGAPLFVVRQLTGKRFTTLCRVELRSIISVEAQDARDRRTHTTPNGYMKYRYLPTLGPDITYLITVNSRHEKCEITIEANDEFAALLGRYSAEARELYAQEEEESEF